MKHIKTFENFSQDLDQEILDEGVIGDLVKKTTDKLAGWNSEENIKWVKKMALAYVNKGDLDKDEYEKAKSLNFDSTKEEVKNFLKKADKLRANLMSVGGHIFGGGA